MKLLYFTDTHIRGTSPQNRLDDYHETLKDKLNEISNIVKEEKIDFVLHGGDLFDRPDVSVSIVSEFAKIFQDFKAPIYIISGNHDIFGHNPDTLDRTMLGLLCNLGVMNLVNYKKIILEKDIRVQLTGSPYVYSMDEKENRKNYIIDEVDSSCKYSIHMTHGFLIDKPFIKEVSHTLIDDIKDTKADITLAGHYHFGFNTVKIDNKYFVNPGALMRISNSKAEISRKPKVNIITLNDGIKIENRYLKSAKPGEEILDRSEMERHQFKGIKLAEFKEIIDSTSDYRSLDIFDLLLKISKSENISDNVKKEALKRVEKAQIDGADY
ncbi:MULTISPECIES: metallophosphoesterase [Peptoniphilus]|uniref:metallophosphoesterase family protein n=1 Tax=Peptoniphilus TaxID=162289 RepID=UPI00028A3492|nr:MULTISPECIES: metallophosphoesterase [Peptoniphilus]MBS6610001.1 metallophosphoesterase family protein [Peptoniphilus harei]MDU5376850.1 metallophosphoesterase [Peptoniphilus lacydonensis]MDU5436437.1 metallophosphoesterase [Peptoniphilus lacydonensis]